jgi:hypothetical protein
MNANRTRRDFLRKAAWATAGASLGLPSFLTHVHAADAPQTVPPWRSENSFLSAGNNLPVFKANRRRPARKRHPTRLVAGDLYAQRPQP